MEKKNEKAIKKDEMMELTPDQMDKVFGGAGGYVGRVVGNDERGKVWNIYNTGAVDDPSYGKCPWSPDGEHEWTIIDGIGMCCRVLQRNKG